MTVPKQVTDGLTEAMSAHNRKESGGTIFDVKPIDGDFVKNLRHAQGLTQQKFALKFGFSLKAVQNWETNERTPEGPTRTYLMVISEIPDEVSSAFERAAKRRANKLT